MNERRVRLKIFILLYFFGLNRLIGGKHEINLQKKKEKKNCAQRAKRRRQTKLFSPFFVYLNSNFATRFLTIGLT